MKIDKLIKVLVNLVLILLIALLVKYLVIVPRDLYAKPGVEYKITNFDVERKQLYLELGEGKLEKLIKARLEDEGKIEFYFQEVILNHNAKKGWRLHSVLGDPSEYYGALYLIFER